MGNAADGYLGDWLPHNDKCRCVDCECDRQRLRIAELKQQAARMRQALEAAEADFVDLNEYWNGSTSDGAAADACQHTIEVTEAALDKLRAALGGPPMTDASKDHEGHK